MGDGVGDSTRHDALEIGELAAKEAVLSIYPNAVCLPTVTMDSRYLAFCYYIKDGYRYLNHEWSYTTEDEAWQGAWRIIQRKMVIQLESANFDD